MQDHTEFVNTNENKEELSNVFKTLAKNVGKAC